MTRIQYPLNPTLTKLQAQLLMNHYGLLQIPFIFFVDFEMETPQVIPLKSIINGSLLFDINGVRNYNLPKESLSKKIILNKFPISFEMYKDAFDFVQSGIQAGDTYLLNLTQPTPIEVNLSLKEIFQNSNAKYKLFLEDKMVCFSPEIFVQIKNGQISSFPMKGTIDAGIPNAEDIILNDPKEKAEHATIVDLIRNDLNKVSKKVKLEKYRYVDKVITQKGALLQVSSKITGVLPENYESKIGDILFSLLPAGSVSGAPKKRTLEIIKSAEQYQRGFYSGVFGYFDGKNLDSGVMIRFIEKQQNQFIFKSGGGITASSNARSEYEEMLQKIYLPL